MWVDSDRDTAALAAFAHSQFMVTAVPPPRPAQVQAAWIWLVSTNRASALCYGEFMQSRDRLLLHFFLYSRADVEITSRSNGVVGLRSSSLF